MPAKLKQHTEVQTAPEAEKEKRTVTITVGILGGEDPTTITLAEGTTLSDVIAEQKKKNAAWQGSEVRVARMGKAYHETGSYKLKEGDVVLAVPAAWETRLAA